MTSPRLLRHSSNRVRESCSRVWRSTDMKSILHVLHVEESFHHHEQTDKSWCFCGNVSFFLPEFLLRAAPVLLNVSALSSNDQCEFYSHREGTCCFQSFLFLCFSLLNTTNTFLHLQVFCVCDWQQALSHHFIHFMFNETFRNNQRVQRDTDTEREKQSTLTCDCLKVKPSFSDSCL